LTKKLRASAVVMLDNEALTTSYSSSTLRAPALRQPRFNLAKAGSIGGKAGE
jgi:hypothetical protein